MAQKQECATSLNRAKKNNEHRLGFLELNRVKIIVFGDHTVVCRDYQ